MPTERVIIKMQPTHTVKTTGMDTSKYQEMEIEGCLSVSDSYHTFDELYDHRITIFIALCRIMYEAMKAYLNLGLEPEKMIPVWRSKVNGDGTTWDGWFVLGIYKENGKQITYHLPLSRWEETDFAEELEKAPDFDGHTSDDVLKRLAIL